MRWTAAKGRNTPTGVGKTVVMVIGERAAGKHPHRRGEDSWRSKISPTRTETPPQAWGRRRAGVHRARAVGNTPTGVGKTHQLRGSRQPCRKHPHRRGEDWGRNRVALHCTETPPQAWGRPSKIKVGDTPIRNTPTGVGKTRRARSRRSPTEKHPHRRGEDSAPNPS